MSLDPNGCDFWMTGEYYATTGLNHQTRIGAFRLPGCTTVGNGTLSGTVTDGTNPIAGATVALGSRTTLTDSGGHYSFTVPAGTYPTLTASAPGFNLASVSTIPVPSGGSATRNFTLSAVAPPPPPPPPPSRTLTVTKAGAGTGTVTSSPAGISCGGTCVATFANGTSVSLSERPGARSRFVGWSGDCSGRSACVLSMTTNHSVKATFGKALAPPSCVVPRVVGKSLAKARAAITRAHCKVGSITRRHSSARKKGKVVGQSPAAGKRLRNGAKVNMVVGKG